VTGTKNGRQILNLTAQKEQARAGRDQQVKVEAEYQLSQDQRPPHKHSTLVVIKKDSQDKKQEIRVESQTTLPTGERLYQAQAQIKKVAESRRGDSQWEMTSELVTQANNQYSADSSIFWAKQEQSLKMETDCKKNSQKVLIAKTTLRRRGESAFEADSYLGQCQVMFDNVRKNAYVQAQMPSRQVSHQTKVNWKRGEVTIDSLTSQRSQQLLKLDALLSNKMSQQSQLQITCPKKSLQLEAKFYPAQGKFELEAQAEQHKYQVLCEGFGTETMDIKAYQIEKDGKTHSKVESRIARRGASHVDFELKNFAQGQIRASQLYGNSRGIAKSFSAQIEGKNQYGFKHSTVFSQSGRSGEPMTFVTLHQDKRGRQLVKVNGELNCQRSGKGSKIELEIPSHEATLIYEPQLLSQSRIGDHNVVLSVKSKTGSAARDQFQHSTAIRANQDRIQIHSVHSVSDKAPLSVSALLDRRADMPSSFGYERDAQRVHFAVQPRGERKMASAQLTDLLKDGYNHSSSVEFNPRLSRYGLTTETSIRSRRAGVQTPLMKMMANVDGQRGASGFELKSRIADAELFVDQAHNNMAWSWDNKFARQA
jgi:hypothetical protein